MNAASIGDSIAAQKGVERMYEVRRVKLGRTAQLDELAHECGNLYSQALVFFWRTVRHKGIWLKPKHLMRLFTSEKLHAHTSDATVQAFCAGLKSWRALRKRNPNAHPHINANGFFGLNTSTAPCPLRRGS